MKPFHLSSSPGCLVNECCFTLTISAKTVPWTGLSPYLKHRSYGVCQGLGPVRMVEHTLKDVIAVWEQVKAVPSPDNQVLFGQSQTTKIVPQKPQVPNFGGGEDEEEGEAGMRDTEEDEDGKEEEEAEVEEVEEVEEEEVGVEEDEGESDT